jgi:hypothetical protein
LAASLFYLCFDLVSIFLCGYRSWVRLEQLVSLLFIPIIEEYATMVEWKIKEENQILGKRHNEMPLLYQKFHVEYPGT